MESKTTLRNIEIRSYAERIKEADQAVFSELAVHKKTLGEKWLQADRLVRNLAVVGGLVLVVTAIKNSTIPESQSVFQTIQESAGMKWDENIGRLTFVNSLLPEEIQEVWGEQRVSEPLCVPKFENVLHSWAKDEPYLLIQQENNTVFSIAEGEIMAIVYGKGDEIILRIRHNSSYESVYGNMEHVFVQIGDYVEANTPLGVLLEGKPLAFELRKNGSSLNPASH